MTTQPASVDVSRKPLRLWPGVVLLILTLLVELASPVVMPDAVTLPVFGGLLGAAAIFLWWLLFSRARWFERLGAIALIVVVPIGVSKILHVSMAQAGMGMLFLVYAIPVMGVALAVWAVATRKLGNTARRISMAAAIVASCGVFALLRTDGVTGGFRSQFTWRWVPTAEQRLLAQTANEPALAPVTVAPPPASVDPTPLPAAPASPSAPAPTGGKLEARRSDVPATPRADAVAAAPAAEWPGFRGPERDGQVRGARRIATDWSATPPAMVWRRPVGPGWSSFAVAGGVFYTQEQRGDDEMVTCYRLATGEPVWRHRDAARFWESNAGAGPRSTPTLADGRVYTLGATGILNALRASDGAVVWSRPAAADLGVKTPIWGFSGSPLVVGDLLVVALSSQLAAFDRASGQPRWHAKPGKDAYSSPHLLTVDGTPQILLMTADGVTSVAPEDGSVLWEHKWVGSPILQPALIPGGDLLISTGGDAGSLGTRRLSARRGPSGWTVEERWTSTGLKPYFNDFVVHAGHVFGFDGSILACIKLEDGARTWKGGRYGYGQLVLLSDLDVMLVLSEQGELVLVSASPGQFRELARVPAIEGKTWNHPVLVGDVLLVRNDQEMAAFRLPLASR